MNKYIVVALAFVAIAIATTEQEYRDAFTSWTHKYSKVYAAEDFFTRYEIFKNNFEFVKNFDKNRGFTVALNKFADFTNAEFTATFTGYRMPATLKMADIKPADSPVDVTGNTVDWRTKGAVTGVKDQGQCGSCWSFSATGSIEGLHFQQTGQLVSLSEQNLVDCSTSQGNEGCNGGLMDYAFEYVISNGGIDTEASYPYTATGPNRCQYSASNKGASITSYADVSSGSESNLQSFVDQGPTSVAIDASHDSFQFYSGGVYYEPDCSSSQLDHGVLAVGYGTDDSSGSAYWIVKNSWGTDWGMNGYINMAKGKSNNCGIATAASRPTK
jgi:cathepsin L